MLHCRRRFAYLWIVLASVHLCISRLCCILPAHKPTSTTGRSSSSSRRLRHVRLVCRLPCHVPYTHTHTRHTRVTLHYPSASRETDGTCDPTQPIMTLVGRLVHGDTAMTASTQPIMTLVGRLVHGDTAMTASTQPIMTLVGRLVHCDDSIHPAHNDASRSFGSLR